MPSFKYQEIPLTFEKGLTKDVEDSVLEAGQLAEISNWQPDVSGALRVRRRWEPLSVDGLTSPYRVRGFGAIGVGATPAVIQCNSSTAQLNQTTSVTLTNVRAGSKLVAIILRDTSGGFTVSTGTSGWTEDSAAASGHAAFSKISSGGTETITVTMSSGLLNHTLVVFECINIGDFDTAGTGVTDTDGSVTASVTPARSAGLALFAYLSNSDTGTVTEGSGLTVDETDNGSTYRTRGSHLTYSAGGAKTESYSSTDGATTSHLWGITYKATNQSQRDFYLTAALATDDAVLNADPTITGKNGIASTSDATTYASNSVAPTTAGSALLAIVANRKGTTPDTPTLSGTNGVNCTWTNVTTVLTSGGLRRFTLFRGTAASTVAGVVTAAFGGATQLTCVAAVYELPADEFDAEASLIVNSTTNTGSSTALSATLPTFAAAQNPTLLFSLTTATAADFTAETGYTELTDTGTGSEGLWLGVHLNKNNDTSPSVTSATNGEWAVIAVELNSAQTGLGYEIWRIPRAEAQTGTWELLDEVGELDENDSPVAMAQGAGAFVWSATPMSNPRYITLSTLATGFVTDVDNAGGSLVYHKDRFFNTGSISQPNRVYYSDLGSPTSWPAANFFDVNGDDGEGVEGLLSAENLLLMAKTNTAWVLSGSGIESFFRTKLPGGSAKSGGPLVSTPYGSIMAGENEIWVVQGGSVDPVSRPITSEWAPAGYVWAAYAVDNAYVLDSTLKKIYRINLVSGSWSTEELLDGDEEPYVLYSLAGKLYYGVENSTTYVGGLRETSNERNYDTTVTQTDYFASTGHLFMLGPQYKYTPRHLFLQIRRHGSSPAAMSVVVYSRSGNDTRVISAADIDDDVVRYRMDLGAYRGEPWLKFDFSHTADADSDALDIEKAILGVDVEQIR